MGNWCKKFGFCQRIPFWIKNYSGQRILCAWFPCTKPCMWMPGAACIDFDYWLDLVYGTQLAVLHASDHADSLSELVSGGSGFFFSSLFSQRWVVAVSKMAAIRIYWVWAAHCCSRGLWIGAQKHLNDKMERRGGSDGRTDWLLSGFV